MPREKTHVRITENVGGGHSLIVDGVDMSMKTLADGFRVEFGAAPDEPDLVHMVVLADVLEIDLPNAAIVALREGDA